MSFIFCDCCKDRGVKLAVVAPGTGLTVWRNRGGHDKHHGSLDSREVLEMLAGTVEGSAIMTFVRQVVG